MTSTTDKLVILFVFDIMEMQLTEDSVLDICCNENNWMLYIDCKEAFSELVDAALISMTPNNSNGRPLYAITNDGSQCLASFYTRIPSHLRDMITDYVRSNRLRVRKQQESFSDYYKNQDGSYSVILKIFDGNQTILDLKLNVATRQTAKWIFKNWGDKASQVYGSIHELLMD